MTIDLGLVLGVVLFLGVVIAYFYNENKELKMLQEELKVLVTKNKADLWAKLESQAKNQEDDVAGLVEKKLASILRSESLHGSGGNLADKLAEHLIALLGKPGSNFNNQFAESLAVVLADKIVLPAELVSSLINRPCPCWIARSGKRWNSLLIRISLMIRSSWPIQSAGNCWKQCCPNRNTGR